MNLLIRLGLLHIFVGGVLNRDRLVVEPQISVAVSSRPLNPLYDAYATCGDGSIASIIIPATTKDSDSEVLVCNRIMHITSIREILLNYKGGQEDVVAKEEVFC